MISTDFVSRKKMDGEKYRNDCAATSIDIKVTVQVC